MNIFATIENWRNYRDTRTQLDRLTTRELDDLGINRVDIKNIAKRSFR